MLFRSLGLLGDDLGRLLFGERYAASGRIGQILLVELGFRCWLWSNSMILVAQQERRSLSQMYLRASCPLLLMYVVVLTVGSRWGFQEQQGGLMVLCASVSVVRSLVLTGLAYGQVRQTVPLPFPWLTLGRALVAGGVAGTLATRLPGNGWGVLGQLAVLSATYTGLLWVFGESAARPARFGLRWSRRRRQTDLANREPEFP